MGKIIGSIMVVAYITMFSMLPFKFLFDPTPLDYVGPACVVVFNVCGGLFMLRAIWR